MLRRILIHFLASTNFHSKQTAVSILGTPRSLNGDHGERVVPRPRTNRRRASSSPRTTLHNNQPPPSAAAVSSPLIGNVRPIPAMPSPLFQQLAQCQLELLGNSLFCNDDDDDSSRGGGAAAGHNKQKKKIKSMALYLPQENSIKLNIKINQICYNLINITTPLITKFLKMMDII